MNDPQRRGMSPAEVTLCIGFCLPVAWAFLEKLFLGDTAAATGGDPLDLMVIVTAAVFLVAGAVWLLADRLRGQRDWGDYYR